MNKVIDLSAMTYGYGQYELSSQSYLSGALSDFVRDDYILTGWNTRAEGNGISYGLSDVICEPEDNLDLYAQWRKNKYLQIKAGSNIFYISDADIEKYGIAGPDTAEIINGNGKLHPPYDKASTTNGMGTFYLSSYRLQITSIDDTEGIFKHIKNIGLSFYLSHISFPNAVDMEDYEYEYYYPVIPFSNNLTAYIPNVSCISHKAFWNGTDPVIISQLNLSKYQGVCKVFNDSFYNWSSKGSITVSVPLNLVTAYQNDPNWSYYNCFEFVGV